MNTLRFCTKKFGIFKNIRRNYYFRESPEIKDVLDCVQTETNNRIGKIILNRPHAFNSLNLDLLSVLNETIKNMISDHHITIINIVSSSDNFSSGMDIKKLYNEGVISSKNNKLVIDYKNLNYRTEYFKKQYELIQTIRSCQKAIVSFITGVCMGNAIPIFAQANGILFSELVMATPESQIGFFPNAGMCYYLSRFGYNYGMYCALTGTEIGPYELIHDNVFKKRGCSINLKISERLQIMSNDPQTERNEPFNIIRTIDHEMLETGKEYYHDVYLREQIDNVFSHDDIETIFFVVRKTCMNSVGGYTDFWVDTYKQLLTASPLSLKVIHRYLKMAKNMSYDEVLRMDYRISINMLKFPDFYYGVHQKLVLKNKEKPNWKYKYLDEVTDNLVDKIFQPVEGENEFGLPSH